jgi:hypothetical protein
VLQWTTDPDLVPDAFRFSTFYGCKQKWLALRELMAAGDQGVSIQPVDFYAHRSTPTLWCSAHD